MTPTPARMALRRAAFAVPLLVVVVGGAVRAGVPLAVRPSGRLSRRPLHDHSDADRALLADELGLHHVVVGYVRALGARAAVRRPRSLPQLRAAGCDGDRRAAAVDLLLTCLGLGLAIVASFVLGVWSGARAGRPGGPAGDARSPRSCRPPRRSFSPSARSRVFALSLGWLPVAGLTDAGTDPTFGQVSEHLVLPVTVLAVSQVPWLAMSVRQSVRDAIGRTPSAAPGPVASRSGRSCCATSSRLRWGRS